MQARNGEPGPLETEVGFQRKHREMTPHHSTPGHGQSWVEDGEGRGAMRLRSSQHEVAQPRCKWAMVSKMGLKLKKIKNSIINVGVLILLH